MSYRFMVLVILAGVMSPAAIAQRIGLLNKLYEAHAERHMVAELKLTEAQVAELEALQQAFRRDQADLIQEVISLASVPVPPGDVPWGHLQPRIETLNRQILKNTRAAMVARKFARYQQLMLQKFLREWRFEEAAALQGRTLEVTQRKAMQMLLQALRSRSSERLATARWEMCSQPLLDFLGGVDIEEQRGDAFGLPTLPRSAWDDPGERVDDVALRLVSAPRVQQHLGCRVDQSRRIVELGKQWRQAFAELPARRALAEALRAEDASRVERAEVDYAQAVAQQAEQLRGFVFAELEPAQQRRLEQLLFQYYVLAREFVPALQVAGVTVPVAGPVGQRLTRAADDVKRRLRYLSQRDRLWVGVQVMDVLLGEGKTLPALGDLVLAPEDPLGQDEELRLQLTKLWHRPQRRSTANPRRERN